MSGGRGRLRVGVGALVDLPISRFRVRAQRIEELGFDQLWVPDERLLRNPYVALATAAAATSVVGLGTAVTNPYTRNAAITAAAIATIDELSGGRTILGLGAGGGLDPYGVVRTSPVGQLRELTAIVRGLTSGKTVDHDGRWHRMIHAHLDFTPVRQVPVYLAARGAKILALGGEIADGVIIGGFASPEGLQYAQRQIDTGLAAAGRTRDAIETVAWIFTSVADDRAATREAVARMVLAAMISSRPIHDQLGVELPAALAEHLDERDWRFPEDTSTAGNLLTDELLDAFAVHGTPDDCLARLEHVCAAGVDQVGFVILPPAGSTVDAVIERLAADVLPALRDLPRP